MDEATARAARAEFYTFVRWFNKNVGTHPIIIGGWAVDHYNDYYGSKDIDVVFEGRRDVYERPLMQYLNASGYRLVKQDPFVETFKKKLSFEGRDIEIDIDAADTTAANLFHAEPGLSIPYSLCSKHCLEVVSEGAFYRVPRLELLLAYKIKAYHDRDFETRQPENAREGRIQYYTSKREKDGSDILALIDSGRLRQKAVFEDGFLRSLIDTLGFGRQAREVIELIHDRPGSRDLYKRIGDDERLALLSVFAGRMFGR